MRRRAYGRAPWWRSVTAAVVAAALSSPAAARAQGGDAGLHGGPTFRDILSLHSVGSVVLSPDGRNVAFTRSVPDWSANRVRPELWIAGGGADVRRVATWDDGFRGGAAWTPDGEWIAYRAAGDGPPRLALLQPEDSERRDVELGVEGAGAFRFSPDGSTVAVLAREPASERASREQELYGPFSFRDEGERNSHVWLVPMDGGAARRLTSGAYTVTDLAWSPDGSSIAIVHQPDAARNSWWKADLSLVDVASGATSPLVAEAGPDGSPMWSPDGSSVAFLSTFPDSITNLPRRLTVVPAAGGSPRVLTGQPATEPTLFAWTASGIWLGALEGAGGRLYRLDPDLGRLQAVTPSGLLLSDASVSPSGAAAVVAATSERMAEIYRLGDDGSPAETVTDASSQVAGWQTGTREVISWTGPGGVRIEGVLHKPDGYDPSHRYPLLVVVHGGPRSVSTPALRPNSGVYPILHFLRKGALVLQPNYRGSVGYGGDFRQLHGRALGWGDAGDVEAGVAHLVAEGLVDGERVGVMGWSYGGFISAYLSATSRAFRAVSVGAGISDWRTHYAWEPSSYTTRFYSFDASPWEDPNAYAVASPITYVNNAVTPTLIQHVDGDPVVTVLNAYELQHALQDRGVENRFVIYPGSAHGVVPLRQRLGALWHNWQWFLEHLWGERVELPLDAVASEAVGGR